jgi:hypothetical protein
MKKLSSIILTSIAIRYIAILLILLCVAFASHAQGNYKPVGAFSVDSTTAQKSGDSYKGHQVFLSSKKNTPFYIVIDKNGNQHAVYLRKQ